MRRPILLAVCLLAVAHSTFLLSYLGPETSAAWTDQGGYQRLGAVLAETGTFTRYPDAPTFVPEVIRTPGYPAFVAAIYTAFGIGNDRAVALAQALVFAAICLLVFAIARRVTNERVALYAAILTALFSPLAYFSTLVVTELWATFMATAAALACLRAIQERRWRDYILAGLLLGATTLVRPVFVLLPFFLALGMPLLVPAHRTRRGLLHWTALAAAAILVLLPWFTYNYVHLGQVTLSPAGGVGRGLWEGSWQGRWPGRVQAELTAIAEQAPEEGVDGQVRAVAARTQSPPEMMLTYVHEWREFHALWDTPQDPHLRAKARVDADSAYLQAALAHIRADPWGHIVRRVTRGAFVLWASEIPLRYTDINGLPPMVIRAIWGVQVILMALAALGVFALARGSRWPEAALLALPLVYVTGVHLPLLCEARQSLPVKPLVLILATVGAAHLRHLWHPSHQGPRS